MRKSHVAAFAGVALVIISALAHVAVKAADQRGEDHRVLKIDLDLAGQDLSIGDIKADEVTVVGATWCAPCKQLDAPVANIKSDGFVIRKVDISDWKGPSVEAVPTTFLYREKTLLSTVKGVWKEQDLRKVIRKPL